MLLVLARILVALAAVALAVVTVLLATNRQSGLRLIGHRVEMLPQAMLVRYGGLMLLAAVGAWLNLRDFLLAVLIVCAVIGFGDAFIYRRAGWPFRLHLIVGGLATLGALLAFFAKS